MAQRVVIPYSTLLSIQVAFYWSQRTYDFSGESHDGALWSQVRPLLFRRPLDLCGLRPLDTERGESRVYSR